MHCSANIGQNEDSALFFGLSGTGKTTLSTDPNRRLIGDDEHGWSDNGIFNFEGGCYAKTINLDPGKEPDIYNAIKPGALLENVITDENGVVDYSDGSITENTRVSYPINYIKNIEPSEMGGHPNNVIFLTCDAFGVLPAVSKLSISEMREHFILGYTAKVAGTESGIKEPQAIFSFCYGEPFMPLKPERYADLLVEYVERYGCDVWLVNTGWSGGAYGVGERTPISTTRSIIGSIHDGTLAASKFKTHKPTGLKIPKSHPKFDDIAFSPELAWKDNKQYRAAARDLRELFENRKKELGIGT